MRVRRPSPLGIVTAPVTQTAAGPDDITRSPLWNPDLAPTPPERRTWSTYNIAALWIGMSVVITTYTLASGLMEQGINWWQAMLTILLGNSIVLVPMVLNAHAGTKYGISFPVLCRASFGVRGANLPALSPGDRRVRLVRDPDLDRRCGAERALPRGMARLGRGDGRQRDHLHAVLADPGRDHPQGDGGDQAAGELVGPAASAGGGILFLWAIRAGGGLGHLLTQSERLRVGNATFWALFPSALTASIGYWATLSLNIPDFTRYARSQRSQMLGQALGLPTTMTAFAFIGVVVTSATIVLFGKPIWDPVALIARIGGAGVIVFAALLILLAQLTTNMAANVVSPSNDFSNLSPKKISYVTGGIITAVIGILMMPWRLYADAAAFIFTWLLGYSSLMGALGGILIADYWIVRRQRLVLDDLFRERGAYSYWKGVNWRAVAAFVIAVLPVVPGFARAAVTPGGSVADPNFFDLLYAYAWFVTFGLSFLVYLGLMRRVSPV